MCATQRNLNAASRLIETDILIESNPCHIFKSFFSKKEVDGQSANLVNTIRTEGEEEVQYPVMVK